MATILRQNIQMHFRELMGQLWPFCVNKMTTTTITAFSWMKKKKFLIKFPLQFVPKGLIDNNPALI